MATASIEIYTLSLHDALPISSWHILALVLVGTGHEVGIDAGGRHQSAQRLETVASSAADLVPRADRKSTRLNSSHTVISYAVFCLKKKKSRARGTQGARIVNI